MLFEWDDAKDESNQKKHGLGFRDARSVFFDSLAVSRPDFHEGEHREQIIGHLYGILIVVVVYTHREREGEEFIRIISARKATALERKLYEAGQWF